VADATVAPARASDPGRATPSRGLTLIQSVTHDAVRRAATAVLEAWRNERGDALDVEDAAGAMAWLAQAADAAMDGRDLPGDNPARTPLGLHLLNELRGRLIRAWQEEAPRPEDAVRILAALERVRDAIEPDWSQHFAARLTGPSGLDLVVEVAHDLRSPITSILFLAETLGKGQSGELNDLQRRQLRLIYSAALGLSSMASDVIELARGGDHLVEKEEAPFSIRELMDGACDLVRPIAEEKGVELRVITPASDRRIGRALVLSRVLLNLTTNALKFTDQGYVEIAAMARGRTEVEFSVRDTGSGMSEEALASLYQPFRRSRSRQGRGGYYFSGTGLGLAMCRKLVQALGSDLAFESRPDWGTRFFFRVRLPAVAAI
jgi:signal transduction histidine kinase